MGTFFFTKKTKTMYLQGFWPKSVFLKCFGNQLKTMNLQGLHSLRPHILRPCLISFLFEIWKVLFRSIDKVISEHRSNPLSPYLSALDFLNFPVWNFKFVELDFFPSLNWIYTACVTCKNPVQTKKKIQFIKLSSSNRRMSKIKCR